MNGAFVNQIELNNYIEKLKCLREIQYDNASNIKKELNKIGMYYSTTNTSELNNKNEKSKSDLDTLKLNLDKYISIIEYIIIKYQLLAKETNKTFDNIVTMEKKNE